MTVLTTDTMSGRTVSSGWGTASDGTSIWGGSASPLASVSSGEARFVTSSPTSFPTEYVTNVLVADAEIVVRVSVGASNNFVYPMIRMQSANPNNCYRTAVLTTTFEIQKLVAGVTTTLKQITVTPPSPSSFYWIRFRVVGINLYAKWWADGSSEPASWMLSTTDTTFSSSGNYGIGATLGSTSSVQIDSLTVYQAYSLQTPTQSRFSIAHAQQLQAQSRFMINVVAPPTGQLANDTMIGRTVSGSFGTASDGSTYGTPYVNLHAVVGVGSNEASIYYDNNGTGIGSYSVMLGYLAARDVTCTMRFNFQSGTNGPEAYLYTRFIDSNNWYRARVLNTGQIYLQSIVGGIVTTTQVASTSISLNTFYTFKFQVQSSQMFIKIWRSSSSEPGSWTWQGTNTAISVAGQFGFGGTTGGTTLNTGVLIDSFLVTSLNLPSSLYVSTMGNDANPGTQSQPLATIQAAMNIAVPGTIVYVSPGAYTQPSGVSLTSNVSGTPAFPIQFISTVRWAAKIAVTGMYGTINGAYTVTNNGSYVSYSGFDITGDGRIGFLNNGNYVTIQYCRVHDIPAYNNGTSGGAGIDNANFTQVGNKIIGNLVFNIGSGTDIGVHGIYQTNSSALVQNNISYNNSGWGIHLFHNPSSCIVSNNLTFNNGYGGIILGADGGNTSDYNIVQNNIIIGEQGVAGAIKETSGIGTHNQYLNNIVYLCANVQGTSSPILIGSAEKTTGQPVGTLFTDPKLINYQSNGSGDYHLQSISPAIGVGITTNAPSTDYDNFLARIQHIDIGPLQYIIHALFPTVSRRTGLFPTTKRRQSP